MTDTHKPIPLLAAAFQASLLSEELIRVDAIERYADHDSPYLRGQLPKRFDALAKAFDACRDTPALVEKTYADGIREAIALLTEWAAEADGNRLDASTPFSADLYRRERDCHSEAAEELAKRIAPATPALQAAE